MAVVVALWCLTILVEWRFTWNRSAVVPCLAGLVLLGVLQLAALPATVLNWLSPFKGQLLQQLEPSPHETFSSETTGEPAPVLARSTLSLYPHGTRVTILRFLAVLLLFVVVQNIMASKESFRRLALVCTANGAALALFALLQFVTSPRHVVFWNNETGGQVFGPFINRNHFAFYLNMCICLTGGLLAGYWLVRRSSRQFSWHALLRHGPSMWLGAFLVLMLISVAFCLSRGGLLALFLSCLAALAVRWTNTTRRSWLEPVVTVLVLTGGGLLAWYVLPRLDPRLAPLWHGNASEGRISFWVTALTVSRDCPLTGSGYGTYGLLELNRRSFADRDPRNIYLHACNDYLEAFAEGGIARFLLTVAIVVLIYVAAVAAYRRYRGHPAAGWVLGGVAAFTTVTVHSFFDFGIHVPAVAFLATVLTAQLTMLGSRRGPDNLPERYEIRMGGLGPLLAALVLLAPAATLAAEGWRLAQAERFRKAAEDRDLHKADESHAAQVTYLEQAVRASPADGELRLALAEAHLWQATATTEPGHRAAAARELLMARDLCPLLPQPHLKLAALTDQFASVDADTVYLRRATQLGPSDPELWFLLGGGQLKAGNQDEALQSWRQSLDLSSQYLQAILQRLGDKLDARQAEQLLPDSPEMLVEAARLLYPEDEDMAARAPLLRRAGALLQQPGSQAKDFYLLGRIQDGLGDRSAALQSYRLALARDGRQTEWRYEWADLLYREGKLKEAEQEVGRVLRENPRHKKAQSLLDAVKREAP